MEEAVAVRVPEFAGHVAARQGDLDVYSRRGGNAGGHQETLECKHCRFDVTYNARNENNYNRLNNAGKSCFQVPVDVEHARVPSNWQYTPD